jgi:hypothetical protein
MKKSEKLIGNEQAATMTTSKITESAIESYAIELHGKTGLSVHITAGYRADRDVQVQRAQDVQKLRGQRNTRTDFLRGSASAG